MQIQTKSQRGIFFLLSVDASRRKRTIVIVLSLLFCFFTATTTLEIVRVSSTSLPYWDSFKLYPVTTIGLDFFAHHNEHLIGTMRLLFKIDEFFTGHKGNVELITILLTLAGTAALLADQLWRCLKNAEKRTGFRVFVTCVFVTAALSAVQFTNLVWQFQVGFVGAFAYSLIALFIFSHSLHAKGFRAVWLAVLACVFGALASYGLFSGSLVWPFLVLMALERRSYRRASFVAALGLIVCWPYFELHPAQVGSVSNSIPFALTFLGSPLGAIFETNFLNVAHLPANTPVIISMAFGITLFVVVATLSFLTLREIRRADINSRDYALTMSCIALCGIVIISACLAAAGRSYFLPLQEAMSSRYTTPPIFLLCCALSLWIWLAWRDVLPSRGIVVALLMMQVLVLVGQPQRLRQATIHGTRMAQAEAAVFNQIDDPQELAFIYPRPAEIYGVLRAIWLSRVSIFAGRPLNGDLGQNIVSWEMIPGSCDVVLQRGPQIQDKAPGWMDERFRWKANVVGRPASTNSWQLRAVTDTLVVGVGAPESRAVGRFFYPPQGTLIIYGPASSEFILVHPTERRYIRCRSNVRQ